MPSVLVVRNDKLGDFMLAWPALAWLREMMPAGRIGVLVSRAVADMAAHCPYIDEVIVDDAQPGVALATRLESAGFDASIVLHNDAPTLRALVRGCIGYRLGPASKLAQLWLTDRLIQRRSKSLKPEFEYNCDLIRRFAEDWHIPLPDRPDPPFLAFDVSSLERLRHQCQRKYGFADSDRLLLVHPGSGGSAANLSPSAYARLIDAIDAPDVFVLVTSGPGESSIAAEVVRGVRRRGVAHHDSSDGLIAFAKLIALSQAFISGSTGPLHIAGALNARTVGFYPNRRSSTALRWQTTNEAARRLAFSPPQSAGESDMAEIDLSEVAVAISRAFL